MECAVPNCFLEKPPFFWQKGEVKFLSAPGKLFVAGEYAVLWGGTARVLAVSPRAWAALALREDRRVCLHLAEGALFGEATPAGVLWSHPVTQPFLFAARALDNAFAAHGQAALGFELAMAPTPLLQGHKLGLGSSARAAVLATKAALLALGSAKNPLLLALRAHADAQNGKGSGADVATCQLGGLVRYVRPPSPGTRPQVHSLHPRPFALAYVFTGQSASTPAMLQAVEARHEAKARQAFVVSSDIWGEQLERAWLQGEFEALAEATEALQALLDGLLGERLPAQEHILRLARAYGCAAKQSGAGGGDGCIVFAPDEGRRDEALEGLRRRGFWGTPLQTEAGVAIESDNTAEAEALKRWFPE